MEQDGHVWHLFVIRTSNRVGLQNYLIDNSIQTLVHYPIPPHRQKAYAEFNGLSFPITEKLSEEILSIPINPIISKDELKIIVKTLNNFKN